MGVEGERDEEDAAAAADPRKFSIPSFWLRITRKGASGRSFPSSMQRLTQSVQQHAVS